VTTEERPLAAVRTPVGQQVDAARPTRGPRAATTLTTTGPASACRSSCSRAGCVPPACNRLFPIATGALQLEHNPHRPTAPTNSTSTAAARREATCGRPGPLRHGLACRSPPASFRGSSSPTSQADLRQADAARQRHRHRPPSLRACAVWLASWAVTPGAARRRLSLWRRTRPAQEPVGLVFESPLRHDRIGAKALVRGGRARPPGGLHRPLVRDLSSNDRLRSLRSRAENAHG
jgi:hypothetical protein